MGKHVDIENAKTPEQLASLKRIMERKECPFCLENFKKEHKHPILKTGKYWIATKNQWPYAGTSTHILLILKNHKEEIEDLLPEEILELGEFILWAKKKFKIKGGAFDLRFGESDFSGSTVTHIHSHIIYPEYGKKVAFWMGKEK